jgi:hypothetical protein
MDETKKDWLRYFKVTVDYAREFRLKGEPSK